MKLLLFTILLISSTNLRLKIAKKVHYLLNIGLKQCCLHETDTGTVAIALAIGNFLCKPSQNASQPCYCNSNCLSNKCVNYTCAKKIVGESCKSNIECSPSEVIYCLGGKCTQYK